MNPLISTIFLQTIDFLPLALGLYISFYILRATDMTLDGSFVLGAGIFARLLEYNISPLLALCCAILVGSIAGIGVATLQRGGKIDALLAGVLATFVLTSVNLLCMGRPNISLLERTTLLSAAFSNSEFTGLLISVAYIAGCLLLVLFILATRYGLLLRAFGDNQFLLQKIGKNIEFYRISGFALTNSLAAFAGCMTAQTVGYADIGMGMGVTLTALGTVILGRQFLLSIYAKTLSKIPFGFIACLIGVLFYFFAINLLLRLSVDPLYLKMLLGVVIALVLRTAYKKNCLGAVL